MRVESPMPIALFALLFPTIQIWSFRILLKYQYLLTVFSASLQRVRSTFHTFFASPAQAGLHLRPPKPKAFLATQNKKHFLKRIEYTEVFS